MFRLWQQLSMAGLIEGSYTGVAGSAGSSHSIRGENSPASRWPMGGWSVIWRQFDASSTIYFPVTGNILAFGTNGINENDYHNGGVMRGAEAWNLDSKWDDGLPATGRIMTRRHSTRPNCLLSDDSMYQLNNAALDCNFVMLSGY
jgi:hypothetical protein